MSSHSHKKKSGFFYELKQIVFILLVVFLIRTFVFGLYQVPTGSMETTMLVGERFFADKFTYLFSKPKQGHIISLNSPLFQYSDNKLTRLFQEYVWGPQNLTKRIIGLPGDLIEGKVEEGRPVIYRNGQKMEELYLNKYPLISVWKRNPRELQRTAEREGLNLISQNKLSPAQFEDYLRNKVMRECSLKTYDPAFSYDKQPFYRIKESLICKDAQGQPIVIYPGTLIEEPKGPNEAPVDKNYWDGTDVFRVKLGANQYWLMGDNRNNSGDSRLFGPVDGGLIHGRILFRLFSLDSDEDWMILDLLKHPIDFWNRFRWSRFLQWVR